jgi:hypothetical protein
MTLLPRAPHTFSTIPAPPRPTSPNVLNIYECGATTFIGSTEKEAPSAGPPRDFLRLNTHSFAAGRPTVGLIASQDWPGGKDSRIKLSRPPTECDTGRRLFGIRFGRMRSVSGKRAGVRGRDARDLVALQVHGGKQCNSTSSQFCCVMKRPQRAKLSA